MAEMSTSNLRTRRPSPRRSQRPDGHQSYRPTSGNGRDMHAPGAYELLLRFDNGGEELRLADHLDFFAREPQTLEFRGRRWRITATEPPSQAGFMARLVCEPEVT